LTLVLIVWALLLLSEQCAIRLRRLLLLPGDEIRAPPVFLGFVKSFFSPPSPPCREYSLNFADTPKSETALFPFPVKRDEPSPADHREPLTRSAAVCFYSFARESSRLDVPRIGPLSGDMLGTGSSPVRAVLSDRTAIPSAAV